MSALAPGLGAGVLIAHTRPVAPEDLARAAGAVTYCPALQSVDEDLIRCLHHHGLRVLAWTVNRPEDWERLLAWDVDGITTDYPDRLAVFLKDRGIGF